MESVLFCQMMRNNTEKYITDVVVSTGKNCPDGYYNVDISGKENITRLNVQKQIQMVSKWKCKLKYKSDCISKNCKVQISICNFL